MDQVLCSASACLPYSRRIAYEAVGSTETSWNAARLMPFNISLSTTKTIRRVSAASLSCDGAAVSAVYAIQEGRYFVFELTPNKNGKSDARWERARRLLTGGLPHRRPSCALAPL